MNSDLLFGLPFVAVMVGVLVVGISLVVVVGVFGKKQDDARAAALRAWAVHRDWTYLKESRDVLERVSGLLPGMGPQRRTRHVVTGRLRGLAITVFAYSWQTESSTTSADGPRGSTSTSHYREVVLAEGVHPLTAMTVGPRSLFTKLAMAFGGQDVDLGIPALSGCRVQADDPAVAAWLLRPLVPFVAGRSDTLIRSDGRVLVVVRDPQTDLAGLTAWLEAVCDALGQLAGPSGPGREPLRP